MRTRPAFPLLALISLLAFAAGSAQEPAAGPQAQARLAEAARGFLEVLTPEQRAVAQFAADAPQRLDWHFTPRVRPGLHLKDMSPEQRARAEALLRAALSAAGAQQVDEVRQLDDVLRWLAERGGGRADHRDSLLYAVAVFGEPETRRPWAFRFEGHHVSVTVSCDGRGGASFSPFFVGASPALVTDGPRAGLRALAAEQDLGLQLFASLTAAQRARAFLGQDVPNDILLPPGAELKRLEPAGLPASELDPAQRQLLARLMDAYLGDAAPELLDPALRNADGASFAWAGAGERQQLHYYRVQTARMVIEFVTTQGDVNHVHAYWRDLERDLTRNWMLAHLAEEADGG